MRFRILIFVSLFLISCKKEEIKPDLSNNDTLEEIRLYGKWLLLDGYIYVDNLETKERVRYNHFDIDKQVSGLHFGNYNFNFEKIEQNITTWQFFEPPFVPGVGEFVLNSVDTLGFNVTKNSWRIIEHPVSGITNQQIGGSARPIMGTEIIDFNDSIVAFYIQQGYTNLNGNNISYINKLIFKKVEGW